MNLFKLFRVYMAEEGGDATGAAPAAAESAPAPSATPGTTTDTLLGADAAPTPEQLAAMSPEERTAHEAKTKQPAKPEGAPEAYEAFKMPEGVEADTALITEFTTVAKELGLSQAQAQKLIDLQAKTAMAEGEGRKAALEKALEAQHTAWKDQVMKDPEIGGDKFDASLATASKAMQAFGSTDLRALLNESGMGSHPEMVKLFHRIGTALTEDKMVLPGNQTTASGEKSIEARLWGSNA